jgi:hypothetical protein
MPARQASTGTLHKMAQAVQPSDIALDALAVLAIISRPKLPSG